MKVLSRILVPVTVMAAVTTGILDPGPGQARPKRVPVLTGANDTVVYPHDGYKLRRTLDLQEEILETGLESMEDSLESGADSAVVMSLRDSLYNSWKAKLKDGDTLGYKLDSIAWAREDSLFVADSIARARAEFDAWFNSLSKKEQRAYILEQKAISKKAEMDSLKNAQEEAKAIKDSIIENTPRILETYAFPDSLMYKRLLTWKMDPDFQQVKPFEYDTAYNYHYYDYPFMRKDVNAAWLGVAGSPLQHYDFSLRRSDEEVEFYKAQESWSQSHRTITHFNTKTPYTELAYYGTILAKEAKESDNLHIFTTQNITPALNFNILFDRFGGGGMLENETTINKTFAVQSNYLGKKYLLHTGYIYNMVSRGENGGITDRMWVRDTSIDAREIVVNLTDASSKIKKHTVYLDQQFRIPFNFINEIKARKDSTFKFDPDSLDKDITTAFVGHSSEFSTYTRRYIDIMNSPEARAFYRDICYYNQGASNDSLRTMKLDNKVYIRLQPWSSNGPISKLNVGLGDYLKTYYAQADSISKAGRNVNWNSVYLYAGAEGQVRNLFNWNAKADYVFAGHDIGNLGVQANAGFNFYPFRRAPRSPLSINANFSTTLKEPDFYQNYMRTNHFRWDNDFSKISETRIGGTIDIPHWKLNAKVEYALLKNNIYYDSLGIVRQNSKPMSVLSASLRKEFVFGPLHLDNRALFQLSSDQNVVPVPTLALNMRYFFQFVVQKDETKTRNIMEMQIGVNAFYNTKWYAPGWNPNIGVFYNQTAEAYNNGPYFDIFMNIQWKRACIFVKYQNFSKGWPMKKKDYFSTHNYIVSQDGLDGLKIGICWPFYLQPGNPKARSSSSSSHSQGANTHNFNEGGARGGGSSRKTANQNLGLGR